jgi:small subunit ribosomal protein S20
MNKKQRNRKHVAQNKRNRIINRRYSSTIKTLAKLFLTKKKEFATTDNKETTKQEMQILLTNFYSIVDKAARKNVIHKNTAARKKSKLTKLYTTCV